MSDKYDEKAKAMDDRSWKNVAAFGRECAAQAFEEAAKVSDEYETFDDGESGPNILGDKFRAKAAALRPADTEKEG